MNPTTSADELLREARLLYQGDPSALQILETFALRLREPMRVAVAGMVKAGKSTLLNAIIGEEIAATDPGECTRIVTWYRYGPVPKLTLYPHSGTPRELPIRRVDGRVVLGLDDFRPEDVRHVIVDWPSPNLEDLTLVDTPGLASTGEAVSARSVNALAPQNAPSDVDAVIYLMRHLHSFDVQFLEALHDPGKRYAGTVNSLVVLSRLDEIGAGRIEALVSARQITDRYRQDAHLRKLSLGVIPVAGLLAQTARTLHESEYKALYELAQMDRAARERTLLSVDRFLKASQPSNIDDAMRNTLLGRFGIFGIRLAVVLIASGTKDAASLAQELTRQSGLAELLDLLKGQFQARASAMKIRAIAVGVEQLLRDQPKQEADKVHFLLERLLSSSHELREFRLLMRLRSGAGPAIPRELVPEAERLLGGNGTAPTTRLGLPDDTPSDEIRQSTRDRVKDWRVLSEHPMHDRATREACRTIIRSCEEILERFDAEAQITLARGRA